MPVLYTPEQQALFDHDLAHWTLNDAGRRIWIHRTGFSMRLQQSPPVRRGFKEPAQYDVETADGLTTIAILQFPDDYTPMPGLPGLLARLHETFSQEHRRLMDVFVDAAVRHLFVQGHRGDHYAMIRDDNDRMMVLNAFDDTFALHLPQSLLPIARQILWTPAHVPRDTQVLIAQRRPSIHLPVPSSMHACMQFMTELNDG